MDRKRFVSQLAIDKAAGEARIKKLAEVRAAAAAVVEELERPKKNLIKAAAEERVEADALTRLVDNAEAQLRADAAPFLAPARSRLWEARQATRGLLDRGGGTSNRAAVEARLEAISAAITQLDEFATSGENDLTAAAKRALTIFVDFETDPRYDCEFSAPPAKRHGGFDFVEANHV